MTVGHPGGELVGGLSVDRLPTRRPRSLRLTQVTIDSCWRFDATDPAEWTWNPFPAARFRFDSAVGSARVRYAGRSLRGAARERWDPDRYLAAGDADTRVVRLSGTIRVIDLRAETVLDALRVDDRISTSRDRETWHCCQVLGDRLRRWLPEMDAVIYRSRTTPETSANIAWHRPEALAVVDVGRLQDRVELLDRLVIADGFTIGFDW